MDMAEGLKENSPPRTPQQVWGLLSAPMGLTRSPAHWLSQQEKRQATPRMEHSPASKYMSQEGYIKKRKSVAKPPEWTSHPLAKDTVLQQISSNPLAEGCCVPRSNSPIPSWAGFGSKEALEEIIKEYIDKCACYYDRDKICEDYEIVQAIQGCDSKAALESGSERQGREILWDLKREKGLYAEQTQVGTYEAAPEEGASTT